MSPVPLFGIPFYFLRHGETESNRLQTIAGSMDVELNDAGRAQARAAIECVRPLGITHVVSSGLRRARDTAAIVAGALALPQAIVPGLAERNWGSLEGRPRSRRVRNAPPPDAEPYEAFAARTRAALATVEARGVPLLVAHSGTFRVLCRLLEIEEPGEQVANCRPIRFCPPLSAGGKWSLEIP
ncbi:MAG TPA: histidine phosphatase family protein [Burkholderiales bacterium]|nr:histidine phosphatase family protein [Burkholderiales bacterium]